MTEPTKKKRSTISLFVAIPLLILVGIMLVAMKVNSFFRKKVISVDDLKFPVLVIQPEATRLFAEWESTALEKFEERSPRTPVDGTIIVDSDLNQYMQGNVHRADEGEIKAIGRYLFPGVMRRKYTFDLKPSKAAGLEGLRALLRTAPSFCDDPTEDAALRSAALQQTTLAGVLDALHFIKPPDPPTTSPVMDGTTSHPVEVEMNTRDPDRPGDAN